MRSSLLHYCLFGFVLFGRFCFVFFRFGVFACLIVCCLIILFFPTFFLFRKKSPQIVTWFIGAGKTHKSFHLIYKPSFFLQGNPHTLFFVRQKHEDIDLNALFNFLASRDAKFLRKQVAIWLASWFDFRKPNLNVTLSDAPPVGSEEYEKLQKHRAQRDRKALRFILRSQWNLGGILGGIVWKELLVLVGSSAYINARWWFQTFTAQQPVYRLRDTRKSWDKVLVSNIF